MVTEKKSRLPLIGSFENSMPLTILQLQKKVKACIERTLNEVYMIIFFNLLFFQWNLILNR